MSPPSLLSRRRLKARLLDDLSSRIDRNSAIHLSGGAFSDVYKCKCRSVTGTSFCVAVKVPRYFECEDPGENRQMLAKLNKDLRRELGLLKRLEHPNLVPLLGTTNTFRPTLCAVLPWMPNGTLHTFLKNKTFAVVERLQLIHGIGSGLEYLHSKNVFHGDLHSGNVLIDEDEIPRISDFGLACTIEKVQSGLTYLQRLSSAQHPGSMRWAAPERLKGSEPRSSGDVYSFGCIMFEVLSGDIPWKDKTEPQVAALKLATFWPPLPMRGELVRKEHWALMVRCWSMFPQRRPNAREVVIAVHTFLELRNDDVNRENPELLFFFL